MLSRSIYNMQAALDAEYSNGGQISDQLFRTLVDVLLLWHKLVLELEAENEAMSIAISEGNFEELAEAVLVRQFTDAVRDHGGRPELVVDNTNGEASQ